MEIDEDSYGTYLMNSRDLCAIDYMEELKDA
jgi:collagenase-like PrtC family protease